MVTTENGRLTDMDLRNGVERVMRRHDWTANRVAAELRCSEDKLQRWIDNPHETAMTTFRTNLIAFVREWDRTPELPPAERSADRPLYVPLDAPPQTTPRAPSRDPGPVAERASRTGVSYRDET